jgi:TolA-binding protein
MAKQCDVCKQTYADELSYCPNCGAWQRGIGASPSSSLDFNLDPRDPDGSGDSGLGGGQAKPASDDIIDIEVLSEGSSTSGLPAPPKAPIAKAVEQPSPASGQSIPQAKPVTPATKPDSSPGPGKATQLAPAGGTATQIAPDQGAASAPGGPIGQSSSADFQLGEAAPATERLEGSSDEFDLGEVPPTESGSDELIEIRHEGSSGEFDLGEVPPSTTPSGTAIEDLVEIQMAGKSNVAFVGAPPSDVNLAKGAGKSGTGRSSDVDLAPSQEGSKTGSSSDVELTPGEEKMAAAAAQAATDEAEDIDIMQLLTEDDSAVELGSSAVDPGSATSRDKPSRPPPGAGAQETSESVIDEDAAAMIRHREDSSAVDLTAPPSSNLPASWIAGVEAPAARAESTEAAPPPAARYVSAPEDEDELAATAPQAAVKTTSPVGAWLGGTGIGVVLGIAACAALWVAGAVPSRDGNSPKKAIPGQSTAEVTQAPREDARALLERGDFARVLEQTNQSGDAGEPDRQQKLAARGEARWWSYLQRQRANLKENDTDVEQAVTDLKEAGTAEAKLVLGQIQERLGQSAEARRIYEDGRKQFPDQKYLFDAALDRLDALSEEPADKTGARKGQPALGEDKALLVLIALQAEQPAAVQPETEAGSVFWNAVKQAKKQNYSDAVAALQKARDIHDRRRFERLRKSQNPISDPTEEIFLRACDELKDYWQLRAKLQSAGYADVAKSRDLGKAVAGLLADLKSKPAADPTLQAVVDRLKQEKDVVSADPSLKEIAKDLDLILDSRKKQAGQLAALREALTGAKLPNDPGELQKGLTKLAEEQKKMAEALAAATKDAERLVADKKTADEKLKATDDKLKSALDNQKADTQTLQELAGKLAGAKVAAANAKGEALVKGLDQLLTDKKAIEEKLKTSGGDQGADVLTLQKVVGKLAAAKIVAANAKGDALVQGLDRVLADRKTAEQNLKQAQADKKSADESLRQAQTARKQAEDELKTVSLRQQADTQLLQQIAGKLTAAKIVAPNARGEVLVKGLEQLIREGTTAPVLPNVPQPERSLVQDSLPTGDPLAAEQAYARGLVNFWSGRYSAAESDFGLAVRTAGSTGQDARYYYFLGLAQLGQGKRDDSQATFRHAGRLERDNRPSSRVVSSALERIQGQARRTVDTYRP